MISIVSTKVEVNPNTFTPQMEFTFTVNLMPVHESIIKNGRSDEDELALAIGHEVIKQAQVHYALTKD